MFQRVLSGITILTLASLSACSQNELTWYKDIKPIVVKRCSECHYKDGPGPIVLSEKPEFISAMIGAIQGGRMPPWPPSEASVELVGQRRVPAAELDLLRQWQSAPALGNAEDYQPPPLLRRLDFDRPPDITLRMSTPYRSMPNPKTGTYDADEFRCFLLPSPPDGWSQGGWLEGYRWLVEEAAWEHHINASIIPASAIPLAQALDGADGRPGWSCPAEVGVPTVGFLNSISSGPDGGFQYPKGWALAIPKGGGLVLGIHYVPSLMKTADRSGVALYMTPNARPVAYMLMSGPADLPCPTGISHDPANPCSRVYAATHTSTPNAEAFNDDILSACGTTLAQQTLLPFQSENPDHWYVNSLCQQNFPASGKIISVNLHAHTRAVSAELLLLRANGTREPLLVVPKWSWVWATTNALVHPISVTTEDKLFVRCVLDNGLAVQWSEATNLPGHDAPATPPLKKPRYHLHGGDFDDDMCIGAVEIAQ